MDWIRCTYIGEGNLLYSVLTQMLMPSRNTFTDRPRIMVRQISGQLWPCQVETQNYSPRYALFKVVVSGRVSGLGSRKEM